MAKTGLTIGLLSVHVEAKVYIAGFSIYHCNFSGGVTDYCEEACCEHSCCSKNAPGYSIHIAGIAVSGTLIVSLLIVLFCMGIWCNSKRKRPLNYSDQLNPARNAAELPEDGKTITMHHMGIDIVRSQSHLTGATHGALAEETTFLQQIIVPENKGTTSTIESRTSGVESASEIVNVAIPQTGVYSYDQMDSFRFTSGLCLETISKDSANGSASHSSEDSNIHDTNLPEKNNYLHNNT